MRISLQVGIFILMLASISCKKNKSTDPVPDPETPVQTGSLSIYFDHKVDSLDLMFAQNYRNANGDTFKVSKFNYFISNIVLTKTDNSNYAEPESYHVVRHSVFSSRSLLLQNVPTGAYKSMSFMLGVDSARNVSGAQSGELDPTKSSDMYWDWNSGYIFLKLEGTSPQSASTTKSITYHIGGYGGVNKTQRNFKMDFETTPALVKESGTIPLVQVTVDVNELFKSPNLIKFASQNSQQSAGAGAKIFADNYANMIKFKTVQN